MSDEMADSRSALSVDGTEFRSVGLDVELRGKGGDGRTLAGILVPYGVQQRIDQHLVEEFVPGAFAEQVRAMTPGRLDGGLVPLCMNHEPHGGVRIGKVTALREDAAGLYGEARIANTSAGNDTLELLNEGILREWSIGFRIQQNRAAGMVTQRIKTHLTELAIVGSGAYGGMAAVASIRSSAQCPACAELAVARTAEPEPASAVNLMSAARLSAALPMLPL